VGSSGSPTAILAASRLAVDDFARVPGNEASPGSGSASATRGAAALAQLVRLSLAHAIDVARADAREKVVPLSQAEAELPFRIG
jgi:hypothetical protein